MIVAYVGIYAYIKICSRLLNVNKENNETLNKKKDYKLLIQVGRLSNLFLFLQSFLICGFLEIQNIAWSLFPKLGIGVDDQWSYVLNFIQNWISIVNNSINPIVLFIFNSEIQMSLKKIFKRKQDNFNTAIQRVSRVQSISTNATGSSNIRRSSSITVSFANSHNF